jgi:hypothetical protein
MYAFRARPGVRPGEAAAQAAAMMRDELNRALDDIRQKSRS